MTKQKNNILTFAYTNAWPPLMPQKSTQCAFVVLQPDTLPRTVVVHGLAELVALARPQSPALQYINSVMIEIVTCSKHLEFSDRSTVHFHLSTYHYLPMLLVFLVSHVMPRFLGLLICQSLCSLHKASAMRILKRSQFTFTSSLPIQHIKQPG